MHSIIIYDAQATHCVYELFLLLSLYFSFFLCRCLWWNFSTFYLIKVHIVLTIEVSTDWSGTSSLHMSFCFFFLKKLENLMLAEEQATEMKSKEPLTKGRIFKEIRETSTRWRRRRHRRWENRFLWSFLSLHIVCFYNSHLFKNRFRALVALCGDFFLRLSLLRFWDFYRNRFSTRDRLLWVPHVLLICLNYL